MSDNFWLMVLAATVILGAVAVVLTLNVWAVVAYLGLCFLVGVAVDPR